MIEFDANTILALLPVAGTALLAMILVAVDLAFPDNDRIVTWVGSIGLIVLMGLVVLIGPFEFVDQHVGLLPGATEVFGGAYVRDGLTAMLDLIMLSIALLTLLFGPDYLRPRGLPGGEFSAMLLFAITGAMLLGGARDLILLFLALELLVLPGYMLAGYAKRDGLSTEGAIKYFLLGSFSSAIFLFGLVLTFGFTGTTGIREVAQSLSTTINAGGVLALAPGLLMGLALLTTGAAFKIAAVPFHYWTPDAYQGSPTPVTGYLSVGPKVAAFALILRLFVEALGPLKADWTPIIVILAAADDDPGQPRCADPGQHQAHARVQLYRAHRLHPRRARHLWRRSARFGGRGSRPAGRSLLQRRLHLHEPGRIRRRRRATAPARRHLADLDLHRAGPARAAARRVDDAVHAVVDGHSTVSRLLGQVVRHRSGAAGRRLARHPGRSGGDQRGHRRVLLPARGRLHVLPRSGR